MERNYPIYDAGIFIQKMAGSKSKEIGDMIISLAKINREFHWSKAYNWYSNLLAEDFFRKCLRASE